MQSGHMNFKKTALQKVVKIICITMQVKTKLNYNDFKYNISIMFQN